MVTLIEETIPMMAEAEHGIVTYHDFVAGIEMGPDLTWQIGANADVTAIVEACRDKWKACIDEANSK